MERREAILLIGPTGAGKSPLGAYLESHGINGRPCRHFDFGAQLRALAALESSADFSDEELTFIRQVLSEGALLEDETFVIAERILLNFLATMPDEAVLLLNGLPRHLGQAAAVDKFIAVEGIIHLDADEETVFERLRRNVGRDRAERTDDAIALVRKKLVVYAERTAPLVWHYENLGVDRRIITVDAEMDGAAVAAEL